MSEPTKQTLDRLERAADRYNKDVVFYVCRDYLYIWSRDENAYKNIPYNSITFFEGQ